MVVLANTPDRYKRLETLDSVMPHTSGNLDLESNLRYYSRRHAATYQTVTAAHQRTGLVEHCLFGLGRRLIRHCFRRSSNRRESTGCTLAGTHH